MKKLTSHLIFFCSLFLGLSTMAQDTMTMPDGTVMPASLVGNQYQFSENYYLVDNTNNCLNFNCFILTNTGSGGGTVSFTKISSGYDGSVYALDGAGNVWNLPVSTTSQSLWTKVTAFGTGLKGIAVRNASEIYVLYPNAACSTGYSINRWDGSRYWGTWGCAFDLSISQDGTLAVIGSDRGFYYTANPRVTQPTWVGIATGTWTSIATDSANLMFGVKNNTLYKFIPGTGVSAVAGAPAVSSAPSSLANSPDGWLYFRSNVATSKGNFYAFSFQNGVFYNMVGTVTLLGGGIRDALFAQNGSTLYHYLNTALGHSSTVHGYYDCGTTGCPAGAVHTAYASGRFPKGTNTATYVSQSGAPATSLSVTYFDNSQDCDPMFGDPMSLACYLSQTMSVNNKVSCSVMGLIYTGFTSTLTIRWEWAYTRAYSLLSYSGCETNKLGQTKCAYDVDNWCSNTATPDLDMHNQSVTEVSGAWKYWELEARCVNAFGLGWKCSHAFGPGFGGVLPPPAPNCTYNP